MPYIKIPFVANTHSLQVNSRIGFLRLLEGFSPVSGRPFPHRPPVGSWPVLSCRARNGFDIAADQRNDFLVGHMVVLFIHICLFY
jgi:hypothetical protein